MKNEDRKNLASVIQANTQRMTVKQLAARGKERHVRVITNKQILELIEAVVDTTISQRVGEMSEQTRQEVIEQSKQEFNRASRLAQDSQSLIQQQKQIITEQRARLEELEKQVAESAARDLVRETREKKFETRLANSQETIKNYDEEFRKLTEQVQVDATLIDELRAGLQQREAELQRLQGALDQASRVEEDGRIDTLREELAAMRASFQQLAERESSQSNVEDRLKAAMDESFARLGQHLGPARGQPVEKISKKASKVMVSRLLDEEVEIDSNLEALDVKVSTTKNSINQTLSRLKGLQKPEESDEPGVAD